VDTHLFPNRDGLVYVSNRKYPFEPKQVAISDDGDCWRADAFDRIVGRKPNPNLKKLDDSLIGMLSRWKRLLAAELSEFGGRVEVNQISALFNSIIFVRAYEDHQRQQL
jgi:hypothetical protein